ncbi:hypothetical protein J3F83DRAFT_221824 [Trichoderma novae-zelandiae]
MVAVGCCKYLTMTNKRAANKYPQVAELLEAFWSTSFVGQPLGNKVTDEADDLYDRPFNLLNVIPDPYWESRRQGAELAKQQAKQPKVRCIRSGVDGFKDPPDRDFLNRVYDNVDEAVKQQPSLILRNTLPAAIEKYALGRRFFITKKGYFGLGPQNTEPGDRIAVLFGSGVPFGLRRVLSGRERGLGELWESVMCTGSCRARLSRSGSLARLRHECFIWCE